jgi:hypothetical protein
VANYNIYGVGKNMFDTLFGIGNETGRTVADALLYVSSDGFGLLTLMAARHILQAPAWSGMQPRDSSRMAMSIVSPISVTAATSMA